MNNLKIFKVILMEIAFLVFGFISRSYIKISNLILSNTTKGYGYENIEGERFKIIGYIMIIFYIILLIYPNLQIKKIGLSQKYLLLNLATFTFGIILALLVNF